MKSLIRGIATYTNLYTNIEAQAKTDDRIGRALNCVGIYSYNNCKSAIQFNSTLNYKVFALMDGCCAKTKLRRI